MVEIADFVSQGAVPAHIVDEFRGRVPEFVERELDPGAFWAAIRSHGSLGFDESFISVRCSACAAPPRSRTCTSATTFVDLVVLDGAEDLEDGLEWGPYPAAVERHGAPAFDESLVFVPLLSLGGSLDVDSMQKRDTITAIQLMVELQGVVEH